MHGISMQVEAAMTTWVMASKGGVKTSLMRVIAGAPARRSSARNC